MTDIKTLKALAEAASKFTEIGTEVLEIWDAVGGYRSAKDADMDFIEAANPAAVLELIAEIERLRDVTKFDDAVACVFDLLKMTAANTGSREWDDQLEDLAEEVIEYAPKYKKQWVDICELARERDQLKAENTDLHATLQAAKGEIERLKADNEALRKDAERYRWLRNPENRDEDYFDGPADNIVVGSCGGEDILWLNDMDREIDAAMSKDAKE